MVLYGPWQNKTVIRFVTDLTQKYVGWEKPIEGSTQASRPLWAFPTRHISVDASVSPSMGFSHPTYFCVRSVTNLITNNVVIFRIICQSERNCTSQNRLTCYFQHQYWWGEKFGNQMDRQLLDWRTDRLTERQRLNLKPPTQISPVR